LFDLTDDFKRKSISEEPITANGDSSTSEQNNNQERVEELEAIASTATENATATATIPASSSESGLRLELAPKGRHSIGSLSLTTHSSAEPPKLEREKIVRLDFLKNLVTFMIRKIPTPK
jgi:hypothetical protein